MHRVVVLAFDRFQSLDVTGPVEAFSIATRYFGGEYEIELVTPDGAPARATSGLSLNADAAIGDVAGPIGTLVIAGGEGAGRAARDERVVAWVREAAGRSDRVASVCTGAFILAAAGLLDGRRATTHWDSCQRLAERHPRITIETDPIFVRDGNVLTSAGVTAGIDLALALIEDDLGPEAALRTAQSLVMFVRRPGGQSQFSAQLKAAPARREPLRDVQAHIAEHPAADLSVPALAARAFMSERNFARAFRAETGMTPAVYVEHTRVERARRELETTDLPVEAVAARCGFGTVETMRRAFARRVGVNPAAYRERFAA
ncbi:MAG TPA: GlxA family transcriptional regulator [Solirubrobacteraceae bacterium]|nr:GlxA family transcriptional regulator [Solirubrobacteraceae bacterium]